ARRDQVVEVVEVDSRPRQRRDLHRLAPAHDADDGQVGRAGQTVGGERVVGPADVGAVADSGEHDAVVGAGELERAFRELLRCRCHSPASATVLRIRTPRINTAGQPWLTGATWAGWPLPQFIAPP